MLVKERGETVSAERFVPEGWQRIRVPCMVLSGLIKNAVYPDLRIGLNVLRIPDSSDQFNQKHDLGKYSYLPDGRNPWRDPYWYRTEFNLPESVRGKRVWLTVGDVVQTEVATIPAEAPWFRRPGSWRRSGSPASWSRSRMAWQASSPRRTCSSGLPLGITPSPRCGSRT